jgi:hypothetical protein
VTDQEEEKSGIGPGHGSDPEKDIYSKEYAKPGSLPMKVQRNSRPIRRPKR